MIALANSNRNIRTTTGGDYVYDPVTGTSGYTSPFVSTVTESQFSTVALYIMPGMRFQKNDNRAFQIAIAGVSVWDNGDIFTFPLPTMSWFFKF